MKAINARDKDDAMYGGTRRTCNKQSTPGLMLKRKKEI